MEGYEMDGAQDAGPIPVETSILDVVGQETGHEPSEASITTLAENTPSTVDFNPATGDPDPAYDPSTGIDLHDVPEILEHYGVTANYVDQTTPTASGASGTGIDILEQDLAAGDKIIAGVSGPGTTTADDAVVITGADPASGIVYVSDHGSEQAVPISEFQPAWDAAGDAMVVVEPTAHDDTSTTASADPHQADPHQADPHQADPHQADPHQAGGGHGLEEATGGAAVAAGITAAALASRSRNKNRKRPVQP
jgi:hypothetical protein